MGPRVRILGLLLVALVMLAGCQMNVVVDVHANADGSGTVTIELGLDDKAVSRLGDVNAEVHVEDMKAAGWTVTPAAKGPDGVTRLRASKTFANPTELKRVIEEVAGAGGSFRDFSFDVAETDAATTRTMRGTVDLTKGIAPYGDKDLAAALDGDAFGGQLATIEAEEGKPIATMVNVEVRVSVGDAPAQVYRPTLADTQPVAVNVVDTQAKPPAILQNGVVVFIVGFVVLLGLIAMLVGVRRRFEHHHE